VNALALIVMFAALRGAPQATPADVASGFENPALQPAESETPVQDVPSIEDTRPLTAPEDGMQEEIRRLMSLQDEIRALLGASSQTQPAVRKGSNQPEPGRSAPASSEQAEPPEPISILGAADALYRAGKYHDALALYRKAADRSDPHAADKEDKCWVLFQQASCLRSTGRPNEALEAYQRLITEYPDTFWAPEAEWWITAVQWKMSFREN